MSGAIAPYLLPGERVLWTGRPRPGPFLRSADALLIPFSLLWGGFALVWNLGVWAGGASLLFRLWGLPFLAVGLHVTLGRFLLDAWLLRGHRYAVTDRRVLILRGRPFGAIVTLDLRRLPEVALALRPDGSGTIRLGPAQGARGAALPPLHAALDPTPQLLNLPDVRPAFDLIQRLSTP